MAKMTKTQISELYVSIFNRASEKSGSENWLNSGYNTDVNAMANAMLDTAAAKTYFGSSLDSNAAFVEHIYANTLNKGGTDVDAEGKAGWVEFLETGSSRGEMVALMIEAISEYKVGGAKYATADQATKDAAQQFVNRVEVSDYTADTLETIAVEDIDSTLSFGSALTVTADATTVAAAKGKIDDVNPDHGETFMLTESLAALAEAKTALTDFEKAAPALDSRKVDTDGTLGSAVGNTNVKAGKVEAKDIKNYYKDLADSVGSNSNTDVAGFDAKTEAVQDAYIAAKKVALSSDVDTAKVEVPANMTSLLNTMETKKDALIADLKAYNKAEASLKAEFAAFNEANKSSGTPLTVASFVETTSIKANEILIVKNYDSATNYGTANNLILVNGVIYDATKAIGTSSKKVELTELDVALRSDELVAKYNAEQAAGNKVTASKDSIATTVESIILAENEAYDVAVGSSSTLTNTLVGTAATVVVVTDTAGSEDVTINLGTVGVDVYKTKAKAEIKNIKYTIDLAGAAFSGTAGDTLSIGGVVVATGAVTTTENADAIAALAVTKGTVKIGDLTYTITASSPADSKITLTAQSTKAVTADLDVVVTGATGIAQPTATKSGIPTETIGDSVKVTSTKADALLDAITAQKDFDALVAQFLEARDLNTDVKALEKAITDAKAAIENDADAVEDAGLGITLVELDSTTHVASSEDEVFLFEDKADFITGFSSSDKIFVGTDYSLVVADKDIDKGSFGDVATLDAIVYDDGTDTFIYFEEETFAGNGSSFADTVKITLNGVTGEEVSINADGFLTIA